MIRYYLLLPLSLSILYYSIFKIKLKKDRKIKFLIIDISIGGVIVSIARILEGVYPESAELIEDIFIVPVFVILLIMFYLFFSIGWRLRNHSDKKATLYTLFYISVATVIFAIIMVILINLGVFK